MSRLHKSVSFEISRQEDQIPLGDIKWFWKSLRNAKKDALVDLEWGEDGSLKLSIDGYAGD